MGKIPYRLCSVQAYPIDTDFGRGWLGNIKDSLGVRGGDLEGVLFYVPFMGRSQTFTFFTTELPQY